MKVFEISQSPRLPELHISDDTIGDLAESPSVRAVRLLVDVPPLVNATVEKNLCRQCESTYSLAMSIDPAPLRICRAPKSHVIAATEGEPNGDASG